MGGWHSGFAYPRYWRDRAEKAEAEVARLRRALLAVKQARLATPDAAWLGRSPFLIATDALDSTHDLDSKGTR